MSEPDDIGLLREYARRNSEEAFATLVTRHVNLVYSVALRGVGNPHAAQEVTQAVFILLAKKARSLSRRTVLSGWLYHAARLIAANFLRTEIRRQRREQEACMQSVVNEPEPETWPQVAPLLDAAIAKLGKKDRDAIVLRFFENKNLREVGAALGASEGAAKMRVRRALEKLRKLFAKRGVTLSAGALAGAVSAHSVHAAPAGLAKTISAGALVKGAAAGGSTLTLVKGALKIMAWTKAKTAIVVGLGVLLAAGTTTVTMKEIRAWSIDNSWRVLPLDSRKLEQVSPQIRIVPTKISSGSGWARNNRMQVMGVGESLTNILGVAFGFWSPARTFISTKLPTGEYDFIANLPKKNEAALQQQIKREFGLTGIPETRETDVLLLRVKHLNSRCLRPSVGNSMSMRRIPGEYIFKHYPVSALAEALEYRLHIPIIDQTGITNVFDFDLKWDAALDEPFTPDRLEGLKTALINQLGLELVPAREPIQMLVVEKTK